MESRPTFFRMARSSVLWFVGLFFAILGRIFAVSGITRLIPELHYQREGVRVRSTVVSKSMERASGRRSSTSYRLNYCFATKQGATMAGSDEIDVDQPEEVKNGDPFEIVHLPASPELSRRETTTDMPLALGFTGIGALTFLFSAVALLAGLRTASRRLHIWREGILAEATVLA